MIARGILCAALVTSASALANELVGVNLSGAEFGDQHLPGTLGTDYTWPTAQEIDYFASRGMNVIRVPFRWERMQQTLNGALDPTYLAALDGIVAHAATKGVRVLFDPHNSARYNGQLVGSDIPNSDLADFWSRMATHYLASPNVIYGLTNEPNTMPTEQWASAANASIVAIRATGATQLISVPGNGYTGAWTWSDNWYGTPNATVMKTITDSGNNFVFEVHQYYDSDGSGTSANCVANQGAARLQDFTNWLRTNHYRGFLGEIAGGNNGGCQTEITAALAHLQANADVWLGWSWWAAGPWWSNYIYTLEPTNNFTTDAPQMAWLKPYIDVIFANGFGG